MNKQSYLSEVEELMAWFNQPKKRVRLACTCGEFIAKARTIPFDDFTQCANCGGWKSGERRMMEGVTDRFHG